MGKKYFKKSGDFNKIHLYDKIDYNSIFGQKINELFFSKLIFL